MSGENTDRLNRLEDKLDKCAALTTENATLVKGLGKQYENVLKTLANLASLNNTLNNLGKDVEGLTATVDKLNTQLTKTDISELDQRVAIIEKHLEQRQGQRTMVDWMIKNAPQVALIVAAIVWGVLNYSENPVTQKYDPRKPHQPEIHGSKSG